MTRSDEEIRADLAVIERVQHPMDQPSVIMLLAADVPALLARAEAAEAQVAQLRAENENWRTRYAEHENAIIWNTTCLNCGNLMDQIYELDQGVVPALRAELAVAQAMNHAIEELFAGGPDTSCRTVWDDGIECVSVPLDDLRAALAAASGVAPDQPNGDDDAHA